MNSIRYTQPLSFGRFRGVTGRELLGFRAGRSYVRWAYRQSDIWVTPKMARLVQRYYD